VIDGLLSAMSSLAPEPEEVLQRARHKLLVGPPPALLKYNGRRPLGSWTSLLTKRIAIDLLRAERRRTRLMQQVAQQCDGADLRSIESQLDLDHHGEQLRQAVKQALAQLSVRDRTLIRMHYAGGVPVEKLAVSYGVHRATLARWIARARSTLAESVLQAMCATGGLTRSDYGALMPRLHDRLDLAISSWIGVPRAPTGLKRV